MVSKSSKCFFFTFLAFWAVSAQWSCLQHTDSAAGVFCYNESSGIASLDPAFAKSQAVMWPVHQIYNTLVEVNDSLETVPSVAESWETEENGLLWRFHLRTDVYFHDDPAFPNGKGRRLTASDVVFSFSRLIDPAVASPGAWIFNGRVDENKPFEALNDSIFLLRLKIPFAPVTGMLSMPYCSVVPQEAVKFYGAEFRRHPVGTGPFVFKAWDEGQALILRRNPVYFEKDDQGNRLPYLSGVQVSFLDSKAAEFLELRQGRLDMVNDVDPSFKDELMTRRGILRKNWEGKLQLLKSPYLNVEYLGFLSDSVMAGGGWSSNVYFRQAVSHAIDRRKLVFFLRNSIGIAAEAGFVPPSFGLGHPFLTAPTDSALAQRLLKLAGYEAGKEEPIILQTVPAYANLGTFIVNELNRNGISAKVEVVQKSLLLDQMSAGRISFFRGSWIGDYPDAENFLSVFYGKNPAPPNYTRFRNAFYDMLYEKAVVEKNDSLRLTYYRAMDSVITQQSPVVPLWYDEVLNLVSTRITGYRPNQRNLPDLRRVKKSG